MHNASRYLAADPFRIAIACCDGTVQGHRPFCDHPRTSCLNPLQVGGIQGRCLTLERSDVDLNLILSQFCDTAPGNLGKRILHRNHDSLRLILQKQIHARWGFAEMATWFQGYINRRVRKFCRIALPQRFDFRMGTAEALVITRCDQLIIMDNHTTDHRIRFHQALALFCQFQGQTHPIFVGQWHKWSKFVSLGQESKACFHRQSSRANSIAAVPTGQVSKGRRRTRS